jgi:hypothetical protein
MAGGMKTWHIIEAEWARTETDQLNLRFPVMIEYS